MLHFSKYQGTGNDFILIDNIHNTIQINSSFIKKLCDRRFGIGADGLMFLEQHDSLDFRMVYFNSNGLESTMCGNGGRCITAFAHDIGLIGSDCSFEAIDGIHQAHINDHRIVSIKMNDINNIRYSGNDFIVDSGSPHYVKFVENLQNTDVFNEGKKIRYSPEFKKDGINVNFIESKAEDIVVRTYERGVEDETFSCGTGVIASVISAHLFKKQQKNNYTVKTKGGELNVRFQKDGSRFHDIWLSGPAEFVFKGEIEAQKANRV